MTRRPAKLPIQKLVPNMVTLSALASGMTSVKFAIEEKWEFAVLAVLAAMLLDGVDGAVARLLRAESRLGAELDSLSDFVSFGVAPAIIIFLWSTEAMGRWGWFLSLVYAIAIALRLARFNIMKDDEARHSPDSPLNRYFEGVPSPVAAGLCLLPMTLSFMTDSEFLRQTPAIVGLWALAVGGLAVSHLPTFSSKQIRLPYRMKIPALCVFGLLAAGLINDPWPTLALLCLAYLATLPFGWLHYERRRKTLPAGTAQRDDDAGDEAGDE